ncbi:cyclic GMP-binding protein C-like isoform X4 [Homarus americanus]|uniref:cyclic GMP-binding protein C-like isoform X4 n=1 Tax=Homarus americanus TaxID=6706 RepID=UPI001C44916C|nr:cyclic GMP-binding protein C-like isoform X4 [Homarus americanus]
MKLKAKLKFLLISGGLLNRGHQHYYPNTTTTITTTTVTNSTTSTTKMSRDYPSTCKSMMDLTGRSGDSEQHQRLHKARSVWDVGGKPAVRRRRTTETFRPPDPVVEPRARPVSLPVTSPVRPKRVSAIQWAEGVGREETDKETRGSFLTPSSAGRPHRYSSSSVTSTPSTPAILSSSSAGDGVESVMFRGEGNLLEAQSMMSLSRPYRVSNGSDDEPRGFRKKSASALHALKNLSRSTPAMSPSASPRHSDSEGPPRVSKGTKKFMRHFADAPASEWVLNYFSCALVSDILLQGTLYITPNFFAFYSKIFGHVSRLLIPVTQVAGIQKERTAKIIPNAVGLQMLDGKSYVFGSLLSRDSTYKLMLHIWKKAQRLADSDSEPPSAVQVAGEEDDGEDSVSGSAESLMEEDQTDSGYLASSPISAVTAVATGATVPWTRDTSSTTTITTTTTAILPGPDICTSSSTSIPLSNLTSSQNPVTLRQGGLSVVKGVGASIPEEPGGAAGVGDGLIQWFIQGSLVKSIGSSIPEYSQFTQL